MYHDQELYKKDMLVESNIIVSKSNTFYDTRYKWNVMIWRFEILSA
jgi:hypothetical protein